VLRYDKKKEVENLFKNELNAIKRSGRGKTE
jgi:hypothetical protein